MLSCRQIEGSVDKIQNFGRIYFINSKRMQRDPLESVNIAVQESPDELQWSMTPSVHSDLNLNALSSGRAATPPMPRPGCTNPIPIRPVHCRYIDPNPYEMDNPPNVLVEQLPTRRNLYRYWPVRAINRRHSYPPYQQDIEQGGDFPQSLSGAQLVTIQQTLSRLEQSVEAKHRLTTIVILVLIGTLYGIVLFNLANSK